MARACLQWVLVLFQMVRVMRWKGRLSEIAEDSFLFRDTLYDSFGCVLSSHITTLGPLVNSMHYIPSLLKHKSTIDDDFFIECIRKQKEYLYVRRRITINNSAPVEQQITANDSPTPTTLCKWLQQIQPEIIDVDDGPHGKIYLYVDRKIWPICWHGSATIRPELNKISVLPTRQ